MLDEKSINTVRKIFSKHDNIMTTAQLDSYRIYYADIQQLLNEGFIEKIKRGYYHWTETYGEQEVKIINRLFPDAVLCMETALFYYQYSDRNPAEWNITIDKNVSRSRTNIDETKGSINFVDVRIYDRDRTICDVLRNMNKMDKEIFNKAIQGYVKDPKKNIPNLMEYAKVLRMQKRVKELIGVWL